MTINSHHNVAKPVEADSIDLEYITLVSENTVQEWSRRQGLDDKLRARLRLRTRCHQSNQSYS